MFGVDSSPAQNIQAQLTPYRNRYFSTASNPFFDQAQFFLPKTIKSIFKFGRWAYNCQDYVFAILSKIPDYVITDVMYSPVPDSKETPEAFKLSLQAWKRVMDREIKLRPLMKGMVKDWQVYGNSFLMMYALKESYLVCTGGCQRTWEDDDPNLSFSGFNRTSKQWYHNCPSCKRKVELKKQQPANAKVKTLRAIRLNPENVYIDFNPLNGESTYYYKIPDNVRQKIKEGSPAFRRSIPERFIEAAEGDSVLEINKGWLHHFKSVGLAEDDMGWGKPPIMPVLRSIYHMSVVKRAEEMILMEHIVPLRIISPGANNGEDAGKWIDLSMFTSQIQQWLQIWKVDQNAIPISNFPVTATNIGGDARALLATPNLMEYYKFAIIAGLGVPREFVEGGLTYSGSSMSIRMLRNSVMAIREDCDETIIFIKDFVRDVYEFNDISIGFTDLSMADDVQKNNQLLGLADKGKISWKTVLQQLGVSSDDERKQILNEMDQDNEVKKRFAIAAAESQAETVVINARAQARAEYENWKAKHEMEEREKQRNDFEMQSKRRAILMSLNDQDLIARIGAGFASVSDIVFLANQGRIPAQIMKELTDSVMAQQAQILMNMGIDPQFMDGLPSDVAVRLSNNVIPPRDLMQMLMQMKAEAEAQAAQAAAEQGQQPQQGGKPQGGGQQGPSPAQQKEEAKVQGYAKELSSAGSPQERAMAESKIRSSDPEGYQKAMQLINHKEQPAPLPEQLPPRRDNGQA